MRRIHFTCLALAGHLLSACSEESLKPCNGDLCDEDNASSRSDEDDDSDDAPNAKLDAGGTKRDAGGDASADASRSSSARDAGSPDAGRDGPAPSAGDGGMAPASPMGDAGAKSEGCGAETFPAAGTKSIDVDGTAREYIVRLPQSYDPNRPYRLVFAWHGLGGSAAMMARSWYGLSAHAEDSAIFIAGQGQPGTGQQAGLASWPNTRDSDITFTRKMLDWAKASYCIDTKRVFSIGMSNGGLMSNVVGCELGDSFRAMVAMSGGGPRGYALKPCTGQLAVWISHGNQDNNVPFSYGQKSRDYWTGANHCSMTTVPATPGTCVEYQGCDEGYPVQFCEFDGGHMVPSFAAEAAWAFFTRF